MAFSFKKPENMTLSLIKFDAHEIRMVGTADRPEWIAADVCEVLGVKNVSDAVGRLDSDEKGIVNTDTPSGVQEILTITEPGLYKLLSRSRKEVGKRFSRFVFHDVLPCIRKHGCYPEPTVEVGNRSLLQIDIEKFTDKLGDRLSYAIANIGNKFDNRCDKIEKKVDDLSHEVQQFQKRKDLSEKTKRLHLHVVRDRYNGSCPCCRKTLIVNSGGVKLAALQYDHWVSKTQPDVAKTWPVCDKCNADMRDGDFKPTKGNQFAAYQDMRREVEQSIGGPMLLGFDGEI